MKSGLTIGLQRCSVRAAFVSLMALALPQLACSKDPPPAQATSRDAVQRTRCMREMGQAQPPVSAAPPEICPADPLPGGLALKTLPVTVRETGVRITAELAVVHEEAERGLMYRKYRLADDRGMLFDLPRKVQTFWMHNTCIPLDMIFVDEDGFVQGIVEQVPTLNDEPRTAGCEGRYVLEVDAGWSRRHGLKPGMHLDMGAPTGVLSTTKP